MGAQEPVGGDEPGVAAAEFRGDSGLDGAVGGRVVWGFLALAQAEENTEAVRIQGKGGRGPGDQEDLVGAGVADAEGSALERGGPGRVGLYRSRRDRRGPGRRGRSGGASGRGLHAAGADGGLEGFGIGAQDGPGCRGSVHKIEEGPSDLAAAIVIGEVGGVLEEDELEGVGGEG